jgi:riboflavin synthase
VFHTHKPLARLSDASSRWEKESQLVPVEHKRGRGRGYRSLVFTGIVRELGRVEGVERDGSGVRLLISAPDTATEARVGDSVSVNGVCLTAFQVDGGVLGFDAVPETLRRSSLGRLEPGAAVNVEPALRAGDPLGGHFVQGHVDGVGRVRAVTSEGLEIEAAEEILRYCVEKGSIAVEGVSLTIAGLSRDSFSVALVPHTRAATTLGALAEGGEVNLEVDLLGKYVERLAAR